MVWPFSKSAYAACALLVLVAVTTTCESERSVGPAGNQRPTVTITAGASEGGEATYRVEFSWFGSDPDGIVDHFLVAVDEGERIGRADSLVWERVAASSAEFLFPATTPDPSLPGDPATASDWHVFHVKAVDDDGAESEADSRHFNAVTIAPTVTVTGVNALYCDAWELVLDGEDLDSPSGTPAGYQLKLVDWVYTTAQGFPIHWLVWSDERNWLIPEEALSTYDSTGWWPPVDAVDPATRVVLPRPDHVGCCPQILGVRAVDEAGAIMPIGALAVGAPFAPGNVFVGEAVVPPPPFPAVAVEGLGAVTPGDTLELRTSPRHVSWAPPVCYGSEHRYAYDHPDPECDTCTAQGGVGGWSEWSSLTELPFPLPRPEDDLDALHTLHVELRTVEHAESTRVGFTIAYVLPGLTERSVWRPNGAHARLPVGAVR